jgi:nitrite reductase/ring-hydroxylating ferredoxin subunit/uncharacterized membrane protein
MTRLLAQRLARPFGPVDEALGRLQGPLRKLLFRVPAVHDFLDGTWLGTPLHPLLTDVPIGATTATLLLDVAETVVPSPKLAVASDGTLAVGVVGALAAAITGVADWRFLRGETRRIATVHGLLNATATALEVTSLALRLTGRRTPGKALSGLGFATTALASHIGGELTFGLGVRVNRTAFEIGQEDFVAVARDDEVQADRMTRVDVSGVPVVLTRAADGGLCAIAATCTHYGGPLDEGTRQGDTVVCPWHGSRFDLCSGAVIEGPAVFPEPRYEARVRNGAVEVRLADGYE